jgi:hypothetical protein
MTSANVSGRARRRPSRRLFQLYFDPGGRGAVRAGVFFNCILIREGEAPSEPQLYRAMNDIGERFREGEAPSEPAFVNIRNAAKPQSLLARSASECVHLIL